MTRKLEFVIDKSCILEESEPDDEIKSESIESLTESNSIDNTQNVKLIITNYDELRNLKARCRLPVDIQLEKEDFLQASVNTHKKYFSFLQTNKNFVSKSKNTESISSCSSSGYSSTSSSPSTSQNYTDELFEINTDRMKTLCEKVIVKQKSMRKSIGTIETEKTKTKGRHSIGICQENTNKNSKYLTVLFDYESHGKEVLNSKVVFSVKKGELVKVLRDYDDNFHLVAKCSDNKIGFLPKDYTVDLVEVKNKVIKKNSILFAENANYVSSSEISSNINNNKISHVTNNSNKSSSSSSRSSSCGRRNYENSNNPLFKLTKL
ncbi:unnamed protein product [Brachionus calyciflorus]|uniref:SH3 domain-containing protein n=1 Tax=Brachionus calyciflorus TaxID=104777 RepID=A0A813Z664_9BILA|nr:unnamed protein product [Brachionus calyciflorus]